LPAADFRDVARVGACHESSSAECVGAQDAEARARRVGIGEGRDDRPRRIVGRMRLSEAKIAFRGNIDELTAGNLSVQGTKPDKCGDISGRAAANLLDLIGTIGGCLSTQPEELAGGVHGEEVNWRSRA